LWHLEIAVWLRGSGLPAIVSALLAVPVALGVAWVLTYRFEQPLLNLDLARLRLPLDFARGDTNVAPISVPCHPERSRGTAPSVHFSSAPPSLLTGTQPFFAASQRITANASIDSPRCRPSLKL